MAILPFILYLLLHKTTSIQLATPYGKIHGAFYVTDGATYSVTDENKEYTLILNFIELLSQIEYFLIAGDIATPTAILHKSLQEVLKQSQNSFVNPEYTDKHIIITEPETAAQSTQNCYNIEGKPLSIANDHSLETVTKLAETQNFLSTANPDSLPLQNYDSFWQNIIRDPTGNFIFADSRLTVPLKLDNKPTIIDLAGLDPSKKCAHFTISTNTFSIDDCNNTNIKKYNICLNQLNQNDVLALSSQVNTFEEQLQEFSTIKSLLIKAFNDLEETPIPDKNKINVQIFSKYQNKIIDNINGVGKNSVNSKGLSVFTTHQRSILKRLSSLYLSLTSKNILHILTFLSPAENDNNQENLLENFYREQIINSKFTKQKDFITITVSTGLDSTQFKSANLLPLIINKKQPSFSGSVLITKDTCFQNSCLGSPCILKDSIKSPCCLRHLLQKNYECQQTIAKSVQYLAKMKENEFLLVTSNPVEVTSSTCPNIKANIEGSFIIAVDIDEVGCNLYLNDLELPTKGAINAQKLLTLKKRVSISFINNLNGEITDNSTSNIDLNKYILPSAVILGALATILGTSITTYLFIKRKNEDEEQGHSDDDVPEVIPLQHLQTLRPIIKTMRFQHSRPVTPISTEDSSSTD